MNEILSISDIPSEIFSIVEHLKLFHQNQPRWLSLGWDNWAVGFSDGLVCRVPRSIEASKKLLREPVVTEAIRNHLTVNIPQLKLRTLNCQTFSLHTVIVGQSVDLIIGSLDRKTKHQLARDLAEQIRCLHSISLGQWMALVPARPSALQRYDSLLPQFSGHPSLKVAIEHISRETVTCVGGHFDLNMTNVIFDEEAMRLTGIIDFMDAAVGDPAEDLSKLLKTDVDFGVAVVNAYRNTDHALLSRASAYAIIELFEDARYAKCGPNHKYVEILQSLVSLS